MNVPTVHKVQFRDSNNNIVDTLELDTNVYRLKTYISHNKKIKSKSISKEVLESWLADNGVYHKYRVASYHTFRRDGFNIELPAVIRIVTEVPDDRNLPDRHVDEGPVGMRDLLRALSIFYEHSR